MTCLKAFLVALLVVSAVGCGSGVRRDDTSPAGSGSAAGARASDTKVTAVTISLSASVKERLAEGATAFNPEELRSNVERLLHAKSLIAPDSNQRLEIELVSFRLRNTFNAVMWGVMSGADHVTGNVKVLRPDGTEVTKFEVSASYALGGWGGGQDQARLGWLFREFANLTAKEMQAAVGKK